MSRSYKRNLVVKDSGRSKRWAKGQANRRVRQFDGEVSSGKWYRRVYNPWNIADWAYRYTAMDFEPHLLYWRNGEQLWAEPEELWRVRMK